jgi:hypothetical protein
MTPVRGCIALRVMEWPAESVLLEGASFLEAGYLGLFRSCGEVERSMVSSS